MTLFDDLSQCIAYDGITMYSSKYDQMIITRRLQCSVNWEILKKKTQSLKNSMGFTREILLNNNSNDT